MEVFVLTALSELRKKSTSWLGGGDKDFHLECDKTIGEVVYLSKIHMRNWLALCSSQNSLFPPSPPIDIIRNLGLKPGQRTEEVGGADQYFRPFVMASEIKSSPEVRSMALDGIHKMIGKCRVALNSPPIFLHFFSGSVLTPPPLTPHPEFWTSPNLQQ